MSNTVVMFEVKPTKSGMQKNLDPAAMLKHMLSSYESLIRAERFFSLNYEDQLPPMKSGRTRRRRNVGKMLFSIAQAKEKNRKSCLKAITSLFARKFVFTPTQGPHTNAAGLQRFL